MNKETFHKVNRIALLLILCLSIVIPLISITISEKNTTEVHEVILVWEQLIVPDTEATEDFEGTSITWIQAVLIIYLSGIIFFTVRNLYSLFQLLLLLKSGRIKRLDSKIKLIVHNKDIAPFSWMKYVVISEKDLKENSREILLHEIAHIKKKHSLDLLLTDICIFFQWFNPAAWLMKQELQNIHEYEADESVINEGVNAKQYQLLLIKKAVGKRLYSMANSFNHSKLKKRITMMSKQKSKSRACLKYLYILPVTALSVVAFARPEVSNQLEELSNAKVNDLTEIVVTKIGDNSSSYESASQDNANVYVINLEDSVANTKAKVNTIVSVVGEKGITPNVVNTTLNIDSLGADQKPLFIVDGKEASEDILKTLKAPSIKSINILKDAPAIKQYGEKGKNGVIVITLKGENEINSDDDITFYSSKDNQVRLINRKITMQSDTVIYKSSGNISQISLDKINIDSIKTKGRILKLTLNGKKASKDSITDLYLSVHGKGNIYQDSIVIINGKVYKKCDDKEQ